MKILGVIRQGLLAKEDPPNMGVARKLDASYEANQNRLYAFDDGFHLHAYT